MLAKPLLNIIVSNEALMRGLADPEARMLVEWVVDQAERRLTDDDDDVRDRIEALVRRARSLGRFVALWCHSRERGAACQLAAAERFGWPLPTHWDVDPCELMHGILVAEHEAAEVGQSRQLERTAPPAFRHRAASASCAPLLSATLALHSLQNPQRLVVQLAVAHNHVGPLDVCRCRPSR